ncbi:MAG: outer membrane chaperone Skp [Algoriphagus sp. 32-45-6]|nr:MAG: outer membrane chaperone Skp [Algoriphagus sp. 32-45-6]
MKKAFKFIGVLFLGSVLVYSCNTKSETGSAASTSEERVAAGDMKVGFVYTDSVINNYEFFKKRSEELTEKGKRFDTDLQSRARGLEQEVATFQQTGGNMTVNQQRAKQEELMQKEQNLYTYRNNLMQELSNDESVLMNEVYEKLQTYMNEFAKEKGLDMILSYTRGGALWYATDAIDLTKEVTDGLNKKLAAAPAAADSTAKK